MKKPINTLASAAFAACSIAFSSTAVADDKTPTHPLSNPTKISLHEAYVVIKFNATLNAMKNHFGDRLDAQILTDFMLDAQRIEYDDGWLMDKAWQVLRQTHGDDVNLDDYAVVCSGDYTTGMIKAIHTAQEDILGNVILSQGQTDRILENLMQTPARIYLQLRYAERRQVERGLNPRHAHCNDSGSDKMAATPSPKLVVQ